MPKELMFVLLGKCAHTGEWQFLNQALSKREVVKSLPEYTSYDFQEVRVVTVWNEIKDTKAFEDYINELDDEELDGLLDWKENPMPENPDWYEASIDRVKIVAGEIEGSTISVIEEEGWLEGETSNDRTALRILIGQTGFDERDYGKVLGELGEQGFGLESPTLPLEEENKPNPQEEEPYVWFDDRDPDNPGWVLRYSTGEELGRRHLDEPLDASNPNKPKQAQREAARFLGYKVSEIGIE